MTHNHRTVSVVAPPCGSEAATIERLMPGSIAAPGNPTSRQTACIADRAEYRAKPVVSQKVGIMAGESSESWYVKASFGTEWGPMSWATLREMADHGDLAPGDLARCGADAAWQPVSEVLDQSRTSESTANFAPQTLSAASETLPAENEATASVPLKPNKFRPGALPNWSSYWGSDPAASELLVVAPRFVLEEEPSNPCHQKLTTSDADARDIGDADANSEHLSLDREVPTEVTEPLRLAVADSGESSSNNAETSSEFAELEAWKRERSERLERLMKIVNERESMAADAARRAAQSETESASAETSADSAAVEAETSTAMPKRAATSSSSSTRRVAERQETWEATLDRWKRSLPDAKAALLLLVLPLAAWWFWPSSDAAIAETYRSMYFQLMELRERPNDKGGMDDFLARSQAELDRIISVLAKRASPNQPDLQWLLWMGRDCLRPMLKEPRRVDSKPERTFNNLMREWQRLNDPNFEPAEASSDPSPAAASASRSEESRPESPTIAPRDSAAAKDDVDADK